MTPRSIALIRPDRLGDVVITLSLLQGLQEVLPETLVTVVAREEFGTLVKAHPAKLEFCALEQAERLRVDLAIHAHPSAEGLQVSAREHVGYGGHAWSRHYHRCMDDERHRGLKHEAEYLAELVRWALMKPDLALVPRYPQEWVFPAQVRERFTAAQQSLGRRWIVVNPSAHSPELRWPWARFVQAAERLCEEHSAQLVLMGEAEDADLVRVARHLSMPFSLFPVVRGCGESLAFFAMLLEGSVVHLARNTGTTHLAAAMGCPVVEVFTRWTGRYSVRRWRVLSSRARALASTRLKPWWQGNRAYWRQCALDVSVEAVVQAAREVVQ